MSASSKPKWPWIVGGIAAFFLLCCGGIIATGIWGFGKGMEAANELKPVTSDILTKMSDSNYDFAAVKDLLDPVAFAGSEAEQMQAEMNGYRDKFGKFKSLGNPMGFNNQFRNGVTTKSTNFSAEFEKGSGTVEVTAEDRNGKLNVVDFRIR